MIWSQFWVSIVMDERMSIAATVLYGVTAGWLLARTGGTFDKILEGDRANFLRNQFTKLDKAALLRAAIVLTPITIIAFLMIVMGFSTDFTQELEWRWGSRRRYPEAILAVAGVTLMPALIVAFLFGYRAHQFRERILWEMGDNSTNIGRAE